MTERPSHISVLLQATLDSLALKEGMRVLDGTFGAGGHSREIAKAIGKSGTLLAFDADRTVFSEERIQELERLTAFSFVVTNFKNAKEALERLELDAAMFDLGLSSTQLEGSGRGFSFRRDEPLAMTFDADPEHALVTARTILNRWDESSIEAILRGFGEERFARSIAKAIVRARLEREITTTGELVDIVRSATPAWYQRGRTDPATRTFQAIRMAVNDELGAIDRGIPDTFDRIAVGGRLAVITFHSIEDRAVKRLFRELEASGKGRIVTKRPLVPGDEEIQANPRARSAKLRVIERC